MMATFFGEVLPVLSRAVDDEDDDTLCEAQANKNDSRKPVLRWCPDLRKKMASSSDGKLSCRQLILAIGFIPHAFVRCHILATDARPVGVISCGLCHLDKNTVTQQTPNDTSCFFYEFDHDVKNCDDPSTSLVCIWNPKGTIFQEIMIIDHLFKTLSPSGLEVFVLCQSYATSFKNQASDGCFLRFLKTDQWKSPLPRSLLELEVPNLLTGTPAAVMSHCQIRGIAAILCACYTDDLRPISANIDAFKPLLESLHMTQNTTDASTSAPAFVLSAADTNLYL